MFGNKCTVGQIKNIAFLGLRGLVVNTLVFNSSAEDRRVDSIPVLPWSLYVSHVLLKFHVIILYRDIFFYFNEDL